MPLSRLTAALCLLAAAASLAAGCGGSDSDPTRGGSNAFRLGLEAPLSGEQSVLGEGMLKGAQLAAAQLNEQRRHPRQGSRDRPDRRRRRSRDRRRGGEAAIDDGLDGVVGPYNSGVGDRDPAALHRRRPGPDQAHLRQLDQRPRLHPAADDLPDRSGRLAKR